MSQAQGLDRGRINRGRHALADRLSANLSAYRHLDGHLALDAWTQAAAATSRALSQALPEIGG